MRGLEECICFQVESDIYIYNVMFWNQESVQLRLHV